MCNCWLSSNINHDRNPEFIFPNLFSLSITKSLITALPLHRKFELCFYEMDGDKTEVKGKVTGMLLLNSTMIFIVCYLYCLFVAEIFISRWTVVSSLCVIILRCYSGMGGIRFQSKTFMKTWLLCFQDTAAIGFLSDPSFTRTWKYIWNPYTLAL